ncbi:MAG: TatD family hydrolase [Actinomycetota bacterium]
MSDTSGPSHVSWVDSHCHVYDETIPGGVDGAVDAAVANGVAQMVVVGCDRATSRLAIEVASRRSEVFATVGLHPHEARHGVDTIIDLIDTPGVVAVGEAGLDYFYNHSPREDQEAAFAAQIELAKRRNLPLVIHTRDAWDDTFAVLDDVGVPERTIFHCFTGGPAEATRALERGAALSFSGIVTFPKAHELHAAAQVCPLDRMLVETDSPYLAPVPHRGKKNQPAWVADVGAAIAALRTVDIDEVADATSATARAMFDLPTRI